MQPAPSHKINDTVEFKQWHKVLLKWLLATFKPERNKSTGKREKTGKKYNTELCTLLFLISSNSQTTCYSLPKWLQARKLTFYSGGYCLAHTAASKHRSCCQQSQEENCQSLYDHQKKKNAHANINYTKPQTVSVESNFGTSGWNSWKNFTAPFWMFHYGHTFYLLVSGYTFAFDQNNNCAH